MLSHFYPDYSIQEMSKALKKFLSSISGFTFYILL